MSASARTDISISIVPPASEKDTRLLYEGDIGRGDPGSRGERGMIKNLKDERRRLCQNLQYLQGIDWAAAVCRINRIDNQLRMIGAEPEPVRRITLEYSPDEGPALADALECVAKAIRKGAGI